MTHPEVRTTKSHADSHIHFPHEIWHLIVDMLDSPLRSEDIIYMPSKFMDRCRGLPGERHDHFRVTNPEDLKSLRLVNKTLNAIASPKLFKILVIRPFQSDVTAWVQKLVAFSKNKLMENVETVWIRDTPMRPRKYHYGPKNGRKSCVRENDVRICHHRVWHALEKKLSVIGSRFRNVKTVMTLVENRYTLCDGQESCDPNDFANVFVARFLTYLSAGHLTNLSVSPKVFGFLGHYSIAKEVPLKSLTTVQRLNINFEKVDDQYGPWFGSDFEGWAGPTEVFKTLVNVRALQLHYVSSINVISSKSFTKLSYLCISHSKWNLAAFKILVEGSSETLKSIKVASVDFGREATVQIAFRDRPFAKLERLYTRVETLYTAADLYPHETHKTVASFSWSAGEGRDELDVWIRSNGWTEWEGPMMV